MEEAIKRDLNIDKMCRSCLMETDEDMNEIFTQQESPDTLSLQQILMQLTANIQVIAAQFLTHLNFLNSIYVIFSDRDRRWNAR